MLQKGRFLPQAETSPHCIKQHHLCVRERLCLLEYTVQLCVWRSEDDLGSQSSVSVHLLTEGEAGEESKKGKGDGKRKDTEGGREAEVRASVYFIALLEVFVSSTC